MKKLLSLICILLVLALLPALPSCQKAEDNGKITILCTLFPMYDWVRNIVGNSENVEVSLLIKNGTDPHSYQPTAADVMAISDCHMIVYIGGEADTWVEEALDRAKNAHITEIVLSELEGMILREVSSSSHSHGEDEHDHEPHHGVFDEHLWLSLENAKTALTYLSSAICAIDGENTELYKENTANYLTELEKVQGEYAAAVESVGEKDRFMLFADRFPFVYLLSEYGVEYSAPFDGCTTDVDAGFDTVLGLIKEADAHGVKYIAVTESSDKALASTVSGSAKNDIEILVMNSLQSVTERQIDDGISYLGVMRENLKVLKKAIGAN